LVRVSRLRAWVPRGSARSGRGMKEGVGVVDVVERGFVGFLVGLFLVVPVLLL
jgi:hypothetical protein